MSEAPFVKGKKLIGYSRDEVAKHNIDGDLWVVIDHYVWVRVRNCLIQNVSHARANFAALLCFRSLSVFQDMHPGGLHVLLELAGGDATEAFFGLHRADVLSKYGRYVIGTISNEKSKIIYPTPGVFSQVPYAEPSWLSKEFHNPYYTDSHRALAKAMRKFVDEEVIPEAREHELSGERPSQELIKKMAAVNIPHMRIGPGPHLKGLTLPGGMKGEDYDYLAELVVTQEFARMGARGFQDGLQAGMYIGLTPIMNFGTDKMKAEVIPAVLSGDKHICLAITEAFAGSDVAGLKTTAVLSDDKTHFVVNGTKKFITNGIWADYFTTAVKTGPGSITMLLIPKSEGVETKKIKTSYSSAAGTTYVTFDNVKVPAENVIGELHQGFKIVLSNFNHERLVMCHFTSRQIRLVTEEAFKWANQRKVFGKPLIDQPVIRQKFGAMFARCEAVQAWLEHITYQMTKMSYAEQAKHLAGPIGLLKAYTTRQGHAVADDAVQILGGRGLTQGGMGGMIELFQRTNKFDAILGGAEEVLYDLGVKQAQKKMTKSVL